MLEKKRKKERKKRKEKKKEILSLLLLQAKQKINIGLLTQAGAKQKVIQTHTHTNKHTQ